MIRLSYQLPHHHPPNRASRFGSFAWEGRRLLFFRTHDTERLDSSVFRVSDIWGAGGVFFASLFFFFSRQGCAPSY